MTNQKIAEVFEEMAAILEIKGSSFFRVNAYRKGAETVRNLSHDLQQMVKNGEEDLEKIPGIGKGLKEKIIDLVKTGKCRQHEDLKKDFPLGLLEILKLRSLGPKKVKLLYEELKIENLKDLEKAAKEEKIQELEGMGEKSEKEILKAINEYQSFSSDRFLIDVATLEVEKYLRYLKKFEEDGGVKKIQFAGSLRRSQETIGDLDILVILDKFQDCPKMMKYFTEYPQVINVLAEGDTKSSVILESGIQVDLRVVKEESFGAALHYFTGSKEHNIQIRDLAKKRGLKVNEYGIFKGDERIVGETEEEMFEFLGVEFIPPELRQGEGELEIFKISKDHSKSHEDLKSIDHEKNSNSEEIKNLDWRKNFQIKNLVELKNIKGDFHSHSEYSDGKNSIEEMAEKFISLGYQYFAVTDHSKAVGITGGMTEDDIKKQWVEIDKLNKKFKGKIKIFKGCEVDILKDGDLDFGQEILENLDVVIISAHLFNNSGNEEQTKRRIKAIETLGKIKGPLVKIIGHPTGRLLNQRAETDFDLGKVIKSCLQNNIALEVNSAPLRLDLPEKYLKLAKEIAKKNYLEPKFVINTDSHTTDHPDLMKFGVGMARRGFLTVPEVINTFTLEKLLSYKS